jgi:hypothetical protein
MHADLCALGFDGSYDAIARFAREWRRQQLELSKGPSKHTYIPLQFKPGEAFQFDWSEDWAVIAAVELALETGAPSKQIVMNILSRLQEGTPIAPIEVPPALAL